jgi:hypothetical protein
MLLRKARAELHAHIQTKSYHKATTAMARRPGRFGSSKIASKMLCQIALGAKMNGSSEGATKTS